MKPEFVDNRELSMADALCGHLDWLEAAYKEPAELSIATGYFNAEGFSESFLLSPVWVSLGWNSREGWVRHS